MKLTNTSALSGNTILQNQHHTLAEESANKKNSHALTINAGRLSDAFDPIARKKQQAQNQAMKIVGDAFAGEREIDADFEERREKIRSLTDEIGINRTAIKQIEETRESLKEKFGIADDSQEQKDLELLAKAEEASFPGSETRLTDDEYMRPDELKAKELTEYQEQSLALKKDEKSYYLAINNAESEIKEENVVISQTQIERLKSNAIGKATNQAEAVLDAASDEIIGMLFEEGKEHIDEEQEEKREQAEEAAEEKKKLEETLEARKEEKEEQEAFTEEIIDAVNQISTGTGDVSQAQAEIKDMINRLKLIEDDVKGAAVDTGI